MSTKHVGRKAKKKKGDGLRLRMTQTLKDTDWLDLF